MDKKTDSPKVLMLGWELPPENTGGLGVACYGLAKGLSGHGVNIAFGLPRPLKTNQDFMTIIDSPIDNMTVTHINANIFPYETNVEYLEKTKHLIEAPLVAPKSIYEASHHYATKAASWAQSIQHDIVHAHDWMTYPAAINVARKSKKPLIAHVHATEHDRTGGHVDQRIADIEYHGLHAADTVIAVSKYTKDVIADKYKVNDSKIKVIHNGIDTKEFSPKAVRKIFPDDHIVTYVGRLTFQKGVEYFLKMAKKVLKTHPNTIFIVAGTGDMYERHILQAAHLEISKRVIFTGFLTGEKLKSIYQMADVFVMPSVSEPYGLVALEALSTGTPIIISNQSGVSETLRHALKVDFWDTRKMAYLVTRVLDNKHKIDHLVSLGQKELQNLSWEKAAYKTLELYQSYR